MAEVRPALIEKRKYQNVHQVPRLEKIVVNMGVSASLEKGAIDDATKDLAQITGGKLHRADRLGSLPVAFANIASELRTQYSLGYYRTDLTRDGKFRKLKVRTTRNGVIVRARPGYRVPKG